MSAYVVTKIVIKRVSHAQIVGASRDLSWVVEQYGTDADATYADRTEELLRISGFDSFTRAARFAYDLAPAEGFPARTEPKHVENPSNV